MSTETKELEDCEIDAQAFIADDSSQIAIEVDPLTKREGIYNDLMMAFLVHYNAKSKQNRGLKIAFFAIIIGLVVAITIGMLDSIKTSPTP